MIQEEVGKMMNVISSGWDFFQHQILGMKWLNEGVGFGLKGLGVDIHAPIGASIQFFVYDVIKITLLLPNYLWRL